MQDASIRHRDAAAPAPLPCQRTLLVLSAAATALMLGWLLHYARYGIDFTDEGLYLNWLATPFLYDWSATQFGFVYHPLFLLWDGDIARLRQSNVLIVFALAWLLFASLLREVRGEAASEPLVRHVLSAGLGVAALGVFSMWLLTPNYNTLTLQALLIAATGVVWTRRQSTGAQVVGAALLGIGGWLTFMGKPSSALALAIVVLLYLIGARRLSLRVLGTAAFTALALLVLSALWIDGSISAFAQRIQQSLAMADHIDSGHTIGQIFRLDTYVLVPREKWAIGLVSGLLLLAVASALATQPRWRYGAPAISLLFLAATVCVTGGIVQGPTGFGFHQGMVMTAFLLVGIALALAGALFSSSQPPFAISHIWLAAFLLVLPYVYAFGTNGNYWWAQGFASVFWLGSCMVLLLPWARQQRGWAFAIPLTFAAQAVCAALLLAGIVNPYRQPQPLPLNQAAVAMRNGTSHLVLAETTARYIDSAREGARASGFREGTPAIDLTGQSPGLLYAIQAHSPGQAWVVGGYPGSAKLAEAALATVSCEVLSQAWLLVEDRGPRSLPLSVVASYGANWPGQFELAASWQTSAGAGGYAQPRQQQLFKPADPASLLQQCRASRPSVQ